MQAYPTAEQILALSVQNATEHRSRQFSATLAPDTRSFDVEFTEELVQLEDCGWVTREGDGDCVVVADVVVRFSMLVGAAAENEENIMTISRITNVIFCCHVTANCITVISIFYLAYCLLRAYL